VSEFVIDEYCRFEPPLEVRDLDGDAAPEILIGVGSDQNAGLAILWNDGSGGFPEDGATRLSDVEGIAAFQLFQATPSSPLLLAYATPRAVNFLGVNGARREFALQSSIPDFSALTGITTGDIDGDGVTDLVVADDGSVRVLRAELDER
jgi:hypothetical protein